MDNHTDLKIVHSVKCTNESIDVKVTNGTRLYGKLQQYPITVNKKFGKYQYSNTSFFSPDKWLSEKEKKELTEKLEERYNIIIED